MFAFSRENSYFERIRMVRMVRMVRSLAGRTFQLCQEPELRAVREVGRGLVRELRAAVEDEALKHRAPSLSLREHKTKN